MGKEDRNESRGTAKQPQMSAAELDGLELGKTKQAGSLLKFPRK
jgi:hypothetical protein